MENFKDDMLNPLLNDYVMVATTKAFSESSFASREQIAVDEVGPDSIPRGSVGASSKLQKSSKGNPNAPNRNIDAPSNEKYEEFRVQYGSIVNQLTQERKWRIQAETQLAAALDEHAKEKKELEQDLDAFRAESDYTQDLRRRYKLLEKEYEELLAKARTSESCHQESSEKELKIAELEQELKVCEPLFQVGLEIRLRFLEMARESVQYVNKRQLNYDTTEIGNSAAHHGNGKVDATLLTSDLLSKKRKNTYSKVYRDVYKHEPAERASMSKIMLEARDYQATILTLKSLNNTTNRPLLQRQRALEDIQIMEEKSEKLSKDEFDSDPDMIRRLALVKENTKEIVEHDRKTRGGVKRPDTSYGVSPSP